MPRISSHQLHWLSCNRVGDIQNQVHQLEGKWSWSGCRGLFALPQVWTRKFRILPHKIFYPQCFGNKKFNQILEVDFLLLLIVFWVNMRVAEIAAETDFNWFGSNAIWDLHSSGLGMGIYENKYLFQWRTFCELCEGHISLSPKVCPTVHWNL